MRQGPPGAAAPVDLAAACGKRSEFIRARSGPAPPDRVAAHIHDPSDFARARRRTRSSRSTARTLPPPPDGQGRRSPQVRYGVHMIIDKPRASAVAAHDEGEETAPTPKGPAVREGLIRALPNCRTETIDRLIQTVHARSVKPGEKIYRQGDPVPLTLILRGFGAARRTTVDGKELVSGVAPAGVLFGWSGPHSRPLERRARRPYRLRDRPVARSRGSRARPGRSRPGARRHRLDGVVAPPDGRAHRRLPPPGCASSRAPSPGTASEPVLRRARRPHASPTSGTRWNQSRDDGQRAAAVGARRDDSARRPCRPEAAST